MNSTQQKEISTYRFIKAEGLKNLAGGDYRIFYIGGESELLTEQNPSLRLSYKASSFKEAMNMLLWEKREAYDLILADIPYNESESPALNRILQSIGYRSVPVIYNLQKLASEIQHQIIRSGIADDIIDFSHLEDRLPDMLHILTKSKDHYTSHSKVTRLKEAVHYGINFNISLKRFIDIALSILFILVLSPVFLIIALAIRLESSGPVIYNSYRAGRGYRVFKFFKFRTMRVGADRMISSLTDLNQYDGGSAATFFKLKNDPRVTRLGALLRKSSLDELPQLFNVLLGDMSIVGNRPLPLYEASQLTTDEFAERFVGPAGITGLWQVEKREKPNMSAEERINLDITYSRKYDLLMDLKIMVRTPLCLIQKTKD